MCDNQISNQLDLSGFESLTGLNKLIATSDEMFDVVRSGIPGQDEYRSGSMKYRSVPAFPEPLSNLRPLLTDGLQKNAGRHAD